MLMAVLLLLCLVFLCVCVSALMYVRVPTCVYVCHHMHAYYHGDQKTLDLLEVGLQTDVSLPVGARI